MKNIKILIVDDDDDDYFLVTDLLKDMDEHQFLITWAANYNEGLKQSKEGDFDICLFDFLLGNKTGLNLLREVRNLGIETPIILLTGRGNKEIDREAMLAGATDYLVKSELELNMLERSIRYAISHGQALKALRQVERNRLNIEKLAATGRFMRALAHEVRNPLTNIDLSVEQLESENTDDELTYYIDIIKRNSLRIGKIITELLQTANPANMNLKKHRLNDLVEAAYERVADRVELKSIKTIKNFTPENPFIDADESKLHIALTNLIVNAIEAMTENKGVLTLETDSTNDAYRIVVEDNGCGMTVEQQNRLFEPYFTGKPKGMGLGMTTTMNIIQSHGAQLLFTSELHKGTRFIISFPKI
ncbi:MAG: response regulator [Saprospiraceae bacterium]|nr:response regulator [Saprospiraceae bacterium]